METIRPDYEPRLTAGSGTVRTIVYRNGGGSDGEIVEIITLRPAPATPEEWTNRFWCLFPQDESWFIEYARSPGISIWVPFDFTPTVEIRSEYAGVSSAVLESILRKGDTCSPEMVDALRQYMRDKNTWDREYERAFRAAVARLPAAPHGFSWYPGMGGLIASRNAGGRLVPLELHFRAWRSDLGYMPHSE